MKRRMLSLLNCKWDYLEQASSAVGVVLALVLFGILFAVLADL